MLVNGKEVGLVKHPVTLYVTAEKQGYSNTRGEGKFKIHISPYDLTKLESCKNDHISITEVKLNLDVPDISGIDFTNIEIEMLERMKKAIQAKCQMQLNDLDSQINSLLAIEHKEE